jgi:hypothetical protein
MLFKNELESLLLKIPFCLLLLPLFNLNLEGLIIEEFILFTILLFLLIDLICKYFG